MKNLMMTKHKSTKRVQSYRLLASLLAFVLMIGCMMIPDTKAQASGLSMGVSASSVKIGDTVTVSITVPAGVSATVNVTYPSGVFSFSSASDTASANGGTVSMTIGSYGSSNTKTTGTMKFKAKAAGSATFSASAPIAGNMDGDRVSISGASASVRVKNESNDSDSSSSNNNSNNNSNNSNNNNNHDGNNDNADDNTRKSADNSLASLTLSAGKLSPAFKYNVTSYTAEVANDVTSVVVSAKPSNAKASVESVKGGENLVVGSNKIQIVVQAENGVTATYTINVTRKEAGATDEEDDPSAQEPDDATDEPQEQCFEIGGTKMYPSKDGDTSLLPDGFTESEITLWDTAYPYWVNEKIGTDVGLIYLVDENKENGAWYRISAASPYEAQSFVWFKSEYGYIIAVPERMNASAPAGYTGQTLNIEDKGVVDAFVKADDTENCLLYAVNQDGAYGLYRYDLAERTYMRYQEETPAQDTQVTEPTTETDNSSLSTLESQNRLLFYAFVVVVAILLLVIIILVVKRKHDGDDPDRDEYDDDEYDDDEYDDEYDEDEDKDNEDRSRDSYDDEDLSDERAGASKRYDRSAFAAKESVPTNTLDLEAVLAQAVADTMSDKEETVKPAEKTTEETLPESTLSEEEDSPKPRKEHRHKKSYREELEEAMDDFDDLDDDFDDGEEEEERPKKEKKKEKRGFFGRRKKKSEDEDEDLEFLDL